MQPRHIVTARLEKLTTALCHRSYIPYLITLSTAHLLSPLIIGRSATRSYWFFFRGVLRNYILRRKNDRVVQESDNRIIRASKSVLALKSAWILHAARTFRSVNVVGEGGAVCEAMPTYARGSNALTFPNVVSRDRGRRSECATPRAVLRATVARDSPTSAAFSCT